MTRRSFTIRRPRTEEQLPLSELKYRRVRVVLRPADTAGRRGETTLGIVCTMATIYGWIWSAVALAGSLMMAAGVLPSGRLPPTVPLITLLVFIEWAMLIGVTMRRVPRDRSVRIAIVCGVTATTLIWGTGLILGGLESFRAFLWVLVLGGGAVCLPAAPGYDAWLRRMEQRR